MDNGKFRLDSKSLFLTYPQCPLPKEVARDLLISKGKAIRGGCVGAELHQDGSPHLHAYLQLEKRYDCRDSSFWDLQGYHGNYQSARKPLDALNYVRKDKDFIEWGDLDVEGKVHAALGHTRYLGKRLIEGEPLHTLTEEYPELLFKYRDIKAGLAAYRQDCAPVLPRCVGFLPNTFGLCLPLLSSKQRHYWFWSDTPNRGKTTFLASIASQYPSFWYSWAEKYQAPHQDSQFVLIDEYSVGHLTVTQLNMMCDGTYQYPVKGSSSVQLISPILLVCGNRNPLEIYDSKYHELLKARFIINCLDL